MRLSQHNKVKKSFSIVMTELRCWKSLEKEREEATEDEETLSNGGADDKQQNDDAGDKDEEDAQKEPIKEESSPEASKKQPTCLLDMAVSFLLQQVVKLFFGCVAAVACGMLYAVYLSTYHERKFWFSTKQELEREITFQEGSGLYYYYYKHMLTAPSFKRGLYELTLDNKTISGQTVNIVQLLFLYPELATSFIYRITSSHDFIEPIYFYVGTVFGLQAVCVTALFVCSWVMSGTWVAGILAVSWYVINRTDTTKVDHAVPLRDNWALPYFSCQVAALTGFLSNISSATEMFCYLTMSATSVSFLLVWEHSHYVLFIQALCLFFLDSFDLVPSRKVADIHKVYLSSLFLAYLLQFQNPVLLSSPLLSILIGSVLARHFQQNMKKGPLVARVLKLSLHLHLVFSTSITFNYLMKKLLPVHESDFILKFLEVKFKLNTTTDFVTNFLLCQESFQTPKQDLFLRLTQASVLPFYFLVLTVCLLSTLQTIHRRLSGQTMKLDLKLEDGRIGEHPEVIYHVFHTLLFGGLALLFDGMKYLWTPYVCMFTAFGVCSPDLWMTVFKWLKLKSIHPVVLSLILSTAVPTIIGFSLWREYCPRVLAELSELQDFYDSDMVELISWIRSQAPASAVFAGSPLLLGAVKLVSGSAMTSLPLYSDINLLKRAEDTYQVYGMKSAEEIYKILTSQKTNYVIIEEAICNELRINKGCRIKDLLDVANGHVVYDRGVMYSFSKYGRFCQEIKLNYSPYKNYFTRVFWNRSYHVYKVNSVISFQY
ncbi:probable C-mannosyltransferase DPY19L4 isoform X3 [Takifugu rubripes]|uniref:probable C-mannosyltransferase DPY19L4 isoform X3 n=1 Tax=Takifugu rubripes TaxID=31033 RepID=UPI0005D1EAAC|nr:probable C-mannosyltransferase DPY19L4 isoform X3 [Takifugu rubripes]|eukprot:XP_011607158.1 PREDICTED: probable C-mannosyltransferase DPY19L4 isoform X3 [Takifugu rubripes]